MSNTLKFIFFQSTFWVSISLAYTRLLSFSVTLLLAKLLLPSDFGIVAYASLITQIIALFRELGLNRTIIYLKKVDQSTEHTAFWIIFAWSLLSYIFLLLFTPLLSKFFNEPILKSILPISGLSIIILSFPSVPIALLEKEMQFRKRIFPEVINITTYTIFTLILVLKGFGYWSIIIGKLLADFVFCISSLIVFKWYPKLQFNISKLKEMLSFGKNILGMGIVSFFIRHIDDAIVGKMLGTVSLGNYDLAYRIGSINSRNLSAIFGNILFPTYNKVRDSKWELSNVFHKVFSQINLISIPIGIAFYKFAPDLIKLIYGNKWDSAIIPMQMMIIQGIIRCFGISIGPVFLSVGKPKLSLMISFGQLIILVVFLYPATLYYALIGVCSVKILGSMYTITTHILYLRKFINLDFRLLLKNIITITIPCLIAGFVSNYFSSEKITKPAFITEFIIFTALAIILLHIFNKDIRFLTKEMIGKTKYLIKDRFLK